MLFDVVHHFRAITREVGLREHEGRPARVVVATRRYPTAPDDLWDALTSAERIPRWFLPITGDLRLGGRYQLQGNAGGEITGCEPPTRLSVTWEFGGEVSWVEVRLSPNDDGTTTLELEHVAHVDDDRWKQYGPGATGVGWDLTLVGLGEHVTRAFTVDPAEVEAFMASEDGRWFVRSSSEAWGEASARAGEPADDARAAADRTTAFYTGVPG